ncbi:HNH endonuclease signature motif containing protein [Leucobacter sp. 7(1)]|uniref:HNH endonuclease signature motif containing protein n=1 Tax=Leucobacter sp. 7(1) TaxID=1255613 RepID=UPI000B3565BA|nr:HNH endonuclease signature motif containing protein [Leucobacter sp. 7(1)]
MSGNPGGADDTAEGSDLDRLGPVSGSGPARSNNSASRTSATGAISAAGVQSDPSTETAPGLGVAADPSAASDTNSGTDAITDSDTSTDTDTASSAETETTPDSRTRDEIRADILADLLTGRNHDNYTGIQGRIQAITPGSLLGIPGIPLPHTTPIKVTLTAAPVAELIGYGPIDLDTAKRLAGVATRWEEIRVTIDGQVMTASTYAPSAAQRRYLAARDQHCRTPGCRVPVHRCDIDHTLDAAKGGPTRIDNLAHLCRSHHVMKHHTGWTIAQHDAGDVTWTDPTGRKYLDRPPSRVRFVPVIEPPADTQKSPSISDSPDEHPF